MAIERVTLVEDVETAMRAAEADRLRQALLTSISHDLRTPLAAIIGAAGTLRDFPDDLAEADRAELLGTVLAEAERLNRFIANLLDMTRLESGAVAPSRNVQDLAEIVGSALQRAARVLADHHVTIDLADDLPMVEIDPVLFEQVLFNLLDNAAKYAPEGSTVRIEARPTASGGGAIRVIDEGEGIPPDEIDRVFDKFHRARRATASAPAPASASRSAAASSRRWAARSPPATAPTAPAPSSPSPCRPRPPRAPGTPHDRPRRPHPRRRRRAGDPPPAAHRARLPGLRRDRGRHRRRSRALPSAAPTS